MAASATQAAKCLVHCSRLRLALDKGRELSRQVVAGLELLARGRRRLQRAGRDLDV